MVSRATVSPSSSSSTLLVVSNWNRTNAFHSHFVPLVLPLFSSKPTILPTSSISESFWSSRTPCSSLSLSLSLTSQHEIYSLKSLELYSRYEFFYAASRDKRLRRVRTKRVLSLKSTGFTYRTKRFIVFFALCARETCLSKTHSRKSRALRTRELFHILLDFLLLLCDSFRTTTRDDTSARCGFSQVYSHVFACV